MATRYFRKQGDGAVPLSNGQRIKFTSVDGGLTAFKAINDDWLAGEFERAMREGRSALTEIDYQTFDREYLQKKSNSPQSRPVWREELVKGQVMPSVSQLDSRLSALPGAAVVVSPPAPMTAPASPMALNQVEANTQIANALPTVESYTPQVGKRRKAKVG